MAILSDYGNNGGKEGPLWHNVGRKPHYMAIYFAEPLQAGAILMREGPSERKSTLKISERKTENKICRKSIFRKKQLPFN